MRSSISRVLRHWELDNLKVAKRIIVSRLGATVLLIGIALLAKTKSTIRADAA